MSENVFGMFNVIGCPLLLTCMCIERYLAVVRPVLYLKARRWEYRVAVSSVVWLLTFSFCLASGKFEYSSNQIMASDLNNLVIAPPTHLAPPLFAILNVLRRYYQRPV